MILFFGFEHIWKLILKSLYLLRLHWKKLLDRFRGNFFIWIRYLFSNTRIKSLLRFDNILFLYLRHHNTVTFFSIKNRDIVNNQTYKNEGYTNSIHSK